jgi:hypothetical protein
VSEKRIYAHVNKNNIIDPKRFAKNIDAQMITARDTANATNRAFVLSKCSQL